MCAFRGAHRCLVAFPVHRRCRSRQVCRRRSGTARPAPPRSGGTGPVSAASSIPVNSSTHSTDAPIRRPVFSSCSRRSAAGPDGVPAFTSAYCPPTMPFTPVAAASSAAAASTRSGGERLVGEQVAKRLRVESVAGEDRHVLAELHVAGGRAPAQLVVVHRRQVVVDQRVGVDQLDRARQRQHLAPARGRRCARWPARAPGGCACRRRAASSASPPPGPAVIGSSEKRMSAQVALDLLAQVVRDSPRSRRGRADAGSAAGRAETAGGHL